jgi:hypothetical protein
MTFAAVVHRSTPETEGAMSFVNSRVARQPAAASAARPDVFPLLGGRLAAGALLQADVIAAPCGREEF